MTAPAPLDAAVREAENALAIEANCITPRCPECFPRFRESLRSLLAAISADKRLEEAEAALRAQDAWELAEERHEKTCAYADCEFRGCPHTEVWAMRAHAEYLRRRYFAAFDRAAGEGEPIVKAEEEDDTVCYHCGASHWCSECQR